METWQEISFDNAFSDITAEAFKIDQSEFLDSGKYPVIDQGQNFIAGYVDDEKLVWQEDLPVVIFGDHTRKLKYVDFPFVLGADGTKVLKPKKDIIPLFAYYQLLSFDIPSAGYSRHFKFLKDFSFRYPALPEQRRIVDLLTRADRLRRLHHISDSLGESLLDSLFLEKFYFGKEKWELSTIEDLAKKKSNSIRTGPFGSQLLHSEFSETGDVLVLGIDNAVQNHFDWGKSRYISNQKYQKLKRYTVFPEDLLITIMATNGHCAVVPNNIPLAINTKHLCCITLDQTKCLPIFLHSCILYYPSVLKQMGVSERGAVMPGLNMEIIKNLVVPVPPMPQQEQYAAVVQHVDSLRARVGESERQAEGLFQSLLAQSFEMA